MINLIIKKYQKIPEQYLNEAKLLLKRDFFKFRQATEQIQNDTMLLEGPWYLTFIKDDSPTGIMIDCLLKEGITNAIGTTILCQSENKEFVVKDIRHDDGIKINWWGKVIPSGKKVFRVLDPL